MKVVLLQNVRGVGRQGDVIEVKEGYFQNFLAPKRLAKLAVGGVLKEVEAMKKKMVLEMEKDDDDAKLVKERLDGKVVTLKHKADGEKLYAKVGVKEVVDAVFAEFKIRLKDKHFVDKLDIKALGKHEVRLKLTQNVSASVFVEVKAG